MTFGTRSRALILTSISAIASACGGRTDILSLSQDTGKIVGQYVVEGTNMISRFDDVQGECTGMAAPNIGNQETVSLESLPQSSNVMINMNPAGCSFVSSAVGNIVQSSKVDCTIVPGKGLDQGGMVRVTNVNFRFDLDTGLYRQVWNQYMNLGASAPPIAKFCNFIDWRVSGARSPSQHWVRFQAPTNSPTEGPHGAACKMVDGNSGTAGFLMLELGQTPNQMVVYVQGVGCSITAQSQDGIVFHADGTDCKLDPIFSIVALGFVSWQFETFTLDLGLRQLSYLAKATRKNSAGELFDVCLQVQSPLTGDLPM